MRRISVIVLMVVLVGAGAAVWSRGSGPLPAAEQAHAAVPVRVAHAETRSLPVFVRGIGHVAPANSVQVKSRVDGQIDRVLFTEGQEVKAGDPLVLIDPRPLQAAVAQAEGMLARDQAQMQSAKSDLERSHGLIDKGFVSRQTVDQQTATAAQFAAAANADQGALDAARLNLSFATVKAPISGRIGKRLVDAGNIVHASDNTSLAEIVQVHPIDVLVTVPQADLPAIRAAQKAGKAVTEAWSTDEDRQLAAGTLILIGNEIDQATGNDRAQGRIYQRG